MNLGGWDNFSITRNNIIGEETRTHCVPKNDLRPHDLDEDCWCHPVEIEAGVFSHNSMDNRESYEEGRKLQ